MPESPLLTLAYAAARSPADAALLVGFAVLYFAITRARRWRQARALESRVAAVRAATP